MMIEEPPIYTETIERARFFQTIHAWPLSDDLNYEGWLKNFDTGEETDIACSILSFFTHYSSKMINQLLKDSVSKAGYFFVKHFSDWKHNDFKTRCIYSYIPGEEPNPTDSGLLFTRKLRDELEIPESQIIDYFKIPSILKSLNAPTPIIFVDDFVGSGAQIDTAWNEHLINGLTLKQVIQSNNHCAVYAPLIVNESGYNRIIENCSGLNLSTTHILGPEYNLFNEECLCWKNDKELYKKGVDLILRKSRNEKIPSTNGDDTRDEKGFAQQGLAISFDHGAPDAIPCFFYWNTNTWTPLINKIYQR